VSGSDWCVSVKLALQSFRVTPSISGSFVRNGIAFCKTTPCKVGERRRPRQRQPAVRKAFSHFTVVGEALDVRLNTGHPVVKLPIVANLAATDEAIVARIEIVDANQGEARGNSRHWRGWRRSPTLHGIVLQKALSSLAGFRLAAAGLRRLGLTDKRSRRISLKCGSCVAGARRAPSSSGPRSCYSTNVRRRTSGATSASCDPSA
jgi:hypothetical protein